MCHLCGIFDLCLGSDVYCGIATDDALIATAIDLADGADGIVNGALQPHLIIPDSVLCLRFFIINDFVLTCIERVKPMY